MYTQVTVSKLPIFIGALMAKQITKSRLYAFQKQSGRCYYCGSHMWQDDQKGFAKKYAISVAAAARFQCTAEHLIARCDGGRNSRNNIVAACLNCNGVRHQRKSPPTHGKYREDIQRRLKKGKWLPSSLQHHRAQSI